MTRSYLPLSGGSDGDRIEAGNDTLMRQAQMTAHTYMAQAVRDIDEIMGGGYAKNHPELIAAYMQTSAMDLGASVVARAIQQVGDSLERFLNSDLVENLRSDHPLQGETFEGIIEQLGFIAGAIANREESKP
jgi:hypothetical protein